MKKPTDFAQHLTAYFGTYLPGLRNMSTNTIASYRDTFRLLFRYCQNIAEIKIENLTINQFTDELVLNFLAWLEKERKCSISTRNQRLACIHAFVRYVQMECPENLLSIQKILSIPSKKCSHESMNYLTVDAMSALLNVPDLTTVRGRRELMLLTLLYDSGARVQEIIDLTARDIRTTAPTTITLHGKGGKARCVPIMSQTNEMMIQYLKEHHFWNRPERLDYPLFFNTRKERLTRAGITYIIKKNVNIAKKNTETVVFPDKISPHVFRHTKAMHMLQSNINLIYIRDFLGHVNVTTTEIYAKADAEIKRKVLEEAYIKVKIPEQADWNEDKNLMEWLQGICK